MELGNSCMPEYVSIYMNHNKKSTKMLKIDKTEPQKGYKLLDKKWWKE